nr:hypothetical protein GCM10020092_079250 [Actinoplanes digitatis]
MSPRWWEGTDLIVTGRGDNEGYHLWIGRERERYAMRPLASIQPNGFTDDTWLGYQCVTGDGLHVVVTVAPRMAVNKPELRDRGGLTYLVNIRTGKVRPAVRGIAFKYHATGCGTGSDVALLRHLDRDQRRSELLRLDAGTGEVSLVSTVNGQLTSPVPSGAGILALRGRTLVRVAKGQPVPTVVARVAGEPYRLTATPTGADLLVDNGNDVRVQRWDTAGLREVAAGPAGGVQLFPGSRGANVTLGATPAERRRNRPPQACPPAGPARRTRRIRPFRCGREGPRRRRPSACRARSCWPRWNRRPPMATTMRARTCPVRRCSPLTAPGWIGRLRSAGRRRSPRRCRARSAVPPRRNGRSPA